MLFQIGAVVLSAYGVLMAAALYFHITGRKADPGDAGFRKHLGVAAFPVLLFLFYYTKTRGLQSAGRYFLPALWSSR